MQVVSVKCNIRELLRVMEVTKQSEHVIKIAKDVSLIRIIN